MRRTGPLIAGFYAFCIDECLSATFWIAAERTIPHLLILPPPNFKSISGQLRADHIGRLTGD